MPIRPTTVTSHPAFAVERRDERAVHDRAPVGLGLNAGDDVAQVDQREDDEDALDDLVVEAQHEEEDDDDRERDDDVAREVEDLAPAAMPANSVAVIRVLMRNSTRHREERHPDAEVLADQTGEALARDAPMRAAISCTTISATASGTSIHRTM